MKRNHAAHVSPFRFPTGFMPYACAPRFGTISSHRIYVGSGVHCFVHNGRRSNGYSTHSSFDRGKPLANQRQADPRRNASGGSLAELADRTEDWRWGRDYNSQPLRYS